MKKNLIMLQRCLVMRAVGRDPVSKLRLDAASRLHLLKTHDSTSGNPDGFAKLHWLILLIASLTLAPFILSAQGVPVTWERVYYSPEPNEAGDDWGLHGVASGGGLFVAVGTDIAVSGNGVGWQRFARPSQAILLSVTFGAGKFVAVAGAVVLSNPPDNCNPSTIIVSEDGTHWTKAVEECLASDYDSLGEGGGQILLNDVAWGNDRFIAIGYGDGRLLLTSTNGVVWQRVATKMDPCAMGIAYGQGTWVTVGDRIFSSSDGLNWTQRPVSSLGEHYWMNRVRYANGQFVATGINPDKVLVSTNGLDWTVAVRPGADTAPFGLAFGDHTWVCVGSRGGDLVPTVWSAGTPMDWRSHDISDVMPGAPLNPRYLRLADVAYADGRFVAVGEAHLILLGTEGPPAPKFSAAQFGPGGTFDFVLDVRSNTTYRIEVSVDLAQWNYLTSMVSSASTMRISDPIQYSGSRFYRARVE